MEIKTKEDMFCVLDDWWNVFDLWFKKQNFKKIKEIEIGDVVQIVPPPRYQLKDEASNEKEKNCI